MSIGKAIAIVGGVVVGAVGAYNYSTTGCPLGTGSCGTEETSAVATQMVAAEGEACPLGCSMESDAKTLAVVAEGDAESCCSMEKAADAVASCCAAESEAAVLAVADKAEGSCCSAEAAEAVEVAEKAESCCGQCGEDADCDPANCEAGDACCKAVASKDD
jgi:hypothetical protein